MDSYFYCFTGILILLAVATVADCAWQSRLACRREMAKVARHREHGIFAKFDKEQTLSSLRKRYVLIYLAMVLFHSAIYLSIHL